MSPARQRLPTTARAVSYKRSQSFLWIYVLVLAGLLFAAIPNARAAFVTTNEAGVDDVFSQSEFGSTPVDIFYNPTTSVANSDLLNINSQLRLDTLFGLNDTTSADVISLYFVDTISWCGIGSPNPSIVGCATLGGNDIVVESAFAGGGFGIELLAHEIGHSLDLEHVMFANLMRGFLDGNTDLNPNQVTDILDSPKTQTAGASRFVEVSPILVTPLPPAVILFVSAILGFLGILHRRKRAVLRPA